MTTITKEQAQKIIDAADDVISALAGTNDDIRPESGAMVHAWDYLNDVAAPPAVVRELARIALASLEAEPMMQEPRNSAGAAEKCRSGENVQVVPPVLSPPFWMIKNSFDPRQSYISGWNACRAAMLHTPSTSKGE